MQPEVIQTQVLPKYIWAPQPGPQFLAYCATGVEELLFGGAKYGGKSDFLLGDYLQDVFEYGRHWQGILIRQSMPELDEVIRRSHELYPQSGGMWKEQKKEWHWGNGACLKMRALERPEDFYKYNGHSYPWIGEDEIGQWASPDGHKLLIGCLRWGDCEIPTKRMRASANPGGAGHQWVRQYWAIDKYPLGLHLMYSEETKMHRVFVPSRVTDNQLGLLRDPNYIHRLKGVGSEAMVKAWLEGDWNVVVGSFFPEFRTFGEGAHVIVPFLVPEHWTRIVGFDWGSYRPFCVGWWAVADGESEGTEHIPRGALVCYREWYGSTGEANKGLKMRNEDIALGILQRTGKGEKIADLVADPSIWNKQGGPSIYEAMARMGVRFRKATNDRKLGSAEFRGRLIGENGRPMIYWFSTCVDSIRTIPGLMHDVHNPEQVDTDGEDHAYDQCVYVCHARPYLRKKPMTEREKCGISEITMRDLFDPTQRGKKKSRRI